MIFLVVSLTLSFFFQQDHLDFSQEICAVNATIATIQENYLELGGEHLNNTLENLSNPLIYEGHVITKRPIDEQECFSSIRQFAEEVRFQEKIF